LPLLIGDSGSGSGGGEGREKEGQEVELGRSRQFFSTSNTEMCPQVCTQRIKRGIISSQTLGICVMHHYELHVGTLISK